MCELFGFTAQTPTEMNGCLRAFFAHSMEQPHGWGMAVFRGGMVNLEKEPLPAWQSGYLESRLRHPICAKTMIAHIRKASVGGMAYENCHPFVMSDRFGRTWTLAHNGTMFCSQVLNIYRDEQEGSTDSERILCHILHRVNALAQSTAETRFQAASQAVTELAAHNQANLLFYDGETLYVHTNQEQKLFFRPEQGGVLIATVPLDDGAWEPVPLTRLLAYQNGSLVRVGEAHSFVYRKEAEEAHDMDSSFL